jgi:hypothetical protein
MSIIRRAWSLTVLVAIMAALAACTATDPRLEVESTPASTHAATAQPAATSTVPGASPAAIGTAHVELIVTTPNVVTIDVTDASATLTSATSGTPGDGASVDAGTLAAANISPTTLRLTWVGGPCDSANKLLIDAGRHRLVLVQPECPGDAIATDRLLDLEFATPINASELETFLQDGLDT